MACAHAAVARPSPHSRFGLVGPRHPNPSTRSAPRSRPGCASGCPRLEAAVATRVYAISDPHDVADPAYLAGPERRPRRRHRVSARRARGRRAPRPGRPTGPARPGPAGRPRRRLPRHRPAPLLRRQRPLRRLPRRRGRAGRGAERGPAPPAARAGDARRPPARRGQRRARARGEEPAEQRRRAAARVRQEPARRRAGRPLRARLRPRRPPPRPDGQGRGGGGGDAGAGGEARPPPARRHREEEPIWACWLGGRRQLEAEQALRALGEISPDGSSSPSASPARASPGWRFSHRQAKAALPIAERRGQPVVRYADVALLASILRDDLVATSLRQLYLEPLEAARDGGKVARETLRAYFEAERNISSTAAALGVDRRTVRNRLRAIEDLLGRPLGLRGRPRDRPAPRRLLDAAALPSLLNPRREDPKLGRRRPACSRGGSARCHRTRQGVEHERKHLIRPSASSPCWP